MGSKGASKDFDYNLIKTLDAVISAGNAAKAAKKLGRDANLVVMVDCQIPADDLVVHFL